MSERQYVIDLEADDAEGHLFRQGIVETDDADWLEEKLRDGGPRRFRVVADDSDDTEGHASAITVRAMIAEDDDDTEGHAISIHFPSRTEADAFRRRLLLTGALVGTVALGAASGAALSSISDQGTAGAGAAQSAVTGSDWTQVERPQAAAGSDANANYQEAAVNEGARQGAADAARAQANANYQEAAVNEGARQGAADAARAEAYENYKEAAVNEGARQGAADAARAEANAKLQGGGGFQSSVQSSSTQAGPMDVHEAPAFQSSTTQAGPMDAHEAPAFQSSTESSSTQAGPMDAHEAPAFQSSTTTDDEGSELNDIGGPTPR